MDVPSAAELSAALEHAEGAETCPRTRSARSRETRRDAPCAVTRGRHGRPASEAAALTRGPKQHGTAPQTEMCR